MPRGDFVQVPTFRIELDHIRHSLLTMVDAQAGELKVAIMKGIQIAYEQIPLLVAERVRDATVAAALEATNEALKEYYGPGGEGYEGIMAQVASQLKGEKS